MTLSTYIQGKYEEAEPLYARATEIWEKALGPEHPPVATVLNNRARLLSAQVRAARNFGEISLWCPIGFVCAQQPGGVAESTGESHQ